MESACLPSQSRCQSSEDDAPLYVPSYALKSKSCADPFPSMLSTLWCRLPGETVLEELLVLGAEELPVLGNGAALPSASGGGVATAVVILTGGSGLCGDRDVEG